jgi:hypothetical protein
MTSAPNGQEVAKLAGNESGRMRRIRLRQLRNDAKERAAAAQDVTVRAIERNARLSLWLVILSAVLMMITAACVGFSVWTTLSEMLS